jgi:hypothetical protein
MKMPIFKVFLNRRTVVQPLGQRDSGSMTMLRPLIVVPTVHRMTEVEEKAFIQGTF